MTPPLSLASFISRLVWLSLLPLILLVMWFGIGHVQDLQVQQRLQAERDAAMVMDQIDHFLQTQIAALKVLASSSLLDKPAQLERFYARTLDYRREFGGHIVLADADMQMLLNTRVPFGTPLPRLPNTPGAVSPQVLATGEPMVGDIVPGPVAGSRLIAIVVPVSSEGKTTQLLLGTHDLGAFQALLAEIRRAPDQTIVLRDGNGQPIARIGQDARAELSNEKPVQQFLAHSKLSRWSVRLTMPAPDYLALLVQTGGKAVLILLLVILAGWLGGRWAGRRIGLAVSALTREGDVAQAACAFAETQAARQLIDAQRQALTTSEQRYRSLFDNQHTVMLLIDPLDSRIIDANPAAEIFYGWSRETLKSKYIKEINTLTAEELARQMQAARETQRNIFHFRHRLASGAIRDVEVHSGPIRLENRVLLYSIIHDETERLAAEHALQSALTAASRFREALEEVDAYVYMKDGDSRYFYANRATLGILGIGAEDLIGSAPERFFTAEVATAIRASDRRVLDGQRIAEEARYLMPDGKCHVFWEIKSPIYLTHEDGRREIWGISGISTDITVFKTLEENLSFLNRRAQILLKLPQLADRLDEAGFMQQALELAEELTGSRISFIHFVNDDEESIELVTWSRRTLETYCQAGFDRHYPVSQAGIWAEALRRRQPVVFNDYATAEGKRGLPEGHAALLRLISLPVIEQGKVVMLAGVGNKAENYEERDVETLQILANDIWRIVQRGRNTEKLARFNRMIERSLNEIYTFDSQTLRFIDVNEGARVNIGYSLDELRTMTPVDIKPQMTPESFARLIEPLRGRKEKFVELTTLHRRKDGSTYDAEIHIELTDDANPVFIAVARDITQRRKAEQELRQALQVVEASPVVSFRWLAKDGWPVDYVSQNVRRWGYEPEDIRAGRPAYAELIHPDDLPRVANEVALHSSAGTTAYLQSYRIRRADGRYFWVEDNTRVIRDENGQPVAYEGVLTDVDLQKAYEQELAANLAEQKALNKKLEAAQNQLLQSEKMASIGQLAAGVAHELNNPIGFVNSNLGTLDNYLHDLFAILNAYSEAEAAAGPQCPQLEHVHAMKRDLDYDFLKSDIYQLMTESKDGLARVAKIVKDLKDFSRAGDSAMQWADLHQGLDSTLNIVWNELKYKCTVTKRYGALPQVWCEPSQLNQVFMNLLVNAGHAIPEKGEIAITTGTNAGGDEVFVAIADTGTGIAPEHLTRIFDPFFTTKPVGKGTGLGLSLAYSIVQKHRGRIEVQSEPGKGSTFTVWLPVKPLESAVPPAPTLEQA